MKFKLTNKQLHHIIKESAIGEQSRSLPAKLKDKINQATEDLASELYGKDYNQDNKAFADFYKLPGYKNDMKIAGGPFSVGNAKLSPDTLIINFTSAFACPSAGQCPVTQAACYAVAGENRLKDTRSKNVKVQTLVNRAIATNKVDKIFDIAKMYIDGLKDSKTPIKWVRFNEAGDFPTNSVVRAAVKFAQEVEREYGVKCMAYTANGRLASLKDAAKVMAINASTNKVLDKMGIDSMKRNFFAAPHQVVDYDFISDKYDSEYEEWKIANNLKSSKKAEEVPFSVEKKLEVNGTTDDITVPILQWGRWGMSDDESGYYYVCPCSFWKDRKDQIEYPYCEKILDRPPYTLKHLRQVYPKIEKNGKMVDQPIVAALTKQLNKIKSPCGISCAVCHDKKGGVVKDTGEQVRDYAIITATHGATGNKFNPSYAHKMRNGDETAEYTKENPRGRWNNPSGIGKYGTPPKSPTGEE